jgi:hypothetical protein
MAKGTTAFGLLFTFKDMASRQIRSATKGVDTLSVTMEDAVQNATKLQNAFEKGKVSRFRQAGSAILSFGKSIASASGSTETFLGSVGDLVGAIPIVGPVIAKTGSFILGMMNRLGELRDEQNRWQVQLGTLGSDMAAFMTPLMDISNTVGMNVTEVAKLTRSMGDASEAGIALTKSAASVAKAFKLENDEAAAFLKTTDALGVSGQTFKELSGTIIQLGQRFKLPDLMREMPEITDEVRKSSLLMGNSFDKRIQPAIKNVAKSAGILSKQLGMMPKQALQVAKGMLGQFQDLAVNMERVFTGVDDDFDERTQNLMEMFVRSGKSGADAFSAIQQAATEGDFTKLGDAFAQVMEKGGIGARRMKVQLQKTFGAEFPKIMEAAATASGKSVEEMFPTDKSDPAKRFDDSVNTMLQSAGNLEQKINSLADNFIKSMGGSMPSAMKKLEEGFGTILGKAGEAQGKLSDFFAGMDKPVAEGIGEMLKQYVYPFVDKAFDKIEKAIKPVFDGAIIWAQDIIRWGKELGPYLQSAVSGLKIAADILGAVGSGLRKILSWLGLAQSEDEVDAEKLRSSMRYAGSGQTLSKADMEHNKAIIDRLNVKGEREAKEALAAQAVRDKEAQLRSQYMFTRAGMFPRQSVHVEMKAVGTVDYNGTQKMEAKKSVDMTGGPVPANK